MLSVRATAMVALLSALAALSIGAYVHPRGAPPPPPHPDATPVSLAIPAPPSDPVDPLAARHLAIPVMGYDAVELHDSFADRRIGHRHEAIDIMAPRGTPVVAADDGTITRLDRSLLGGIAIYQSDPSSRFVYYYAHLDRYAAGLAEGKEVKRGQVIAYVGSTGNAPARAPHLHFTIFIVGADRKWWRGKAVNPFPYLAASR